MICQQNLNNFEKIEIKRLFEKYSLQGAIKGMNNDCDRDPCAPASKSPSGDQTNG